MNHHQCCIVFFGDWKIFMYVSFILLEIRWNNFTVGTSVGNSEGFRVGKVEGLIEGRFVGSIVGSFEGWGEGWYVGATVGFKLGCIEGLIVGFKVGKKLGETEGHLVGSRDGMHVGVAVGSNSRISKLKKRITKIFLRNEPEQLLLRLLLFWSFKIFQVSYNHMIDYQKVFQWYNHYWKLQSFFSKK